MDILVVGGGIGGLTAALAHWNPRSPNAERLLHSSQAQGTFARVALSAGSGRKIAG